MAKRSWITRTESTASRTPGVGRCSSNSLVTTMVLLMDRAAPTKIASTGLQPRARAAETPRSRARPTCMEPMRRAVGPARKSFWRLNSMPMVYIRRITPSSDMVRTLRSSAARGIGRWGPTTMPAST